MKKEPMTKKEYITLMSIAIVLLLTFFGLLATAAILQDNGVSPKIYNPIGISSFAFIIAALVVLFANLKRVTEYEIAAKIKKVDETECTILENATEAKIKDALIKSGFAQRDEYYYKRKFSLAKDYINYFVRFANSINVASSIESEMAKIDAKNYSNQNKCMILILSLDTVSAEDIEEMKKFNKAFIVAEHIDPWIDSAICVLIDKSNNKAYFIKNNKFSVSIYSHSTKLIEKLISG